MRSLITTLLFTSLVSIAWGQPEMTLWIAPDGYHHDHSHDDMVAYPCDSSYYIFYSQEPGTIPIAIKNEGDQILTITEVFTEAIEGATFTTDLSFPQQVLPGEMLEIEVSYQLPVDYQNGVNGEITLESNDPIHPTCSIKFDIGCTPTIEIDDGSRFGVSGNTCSQYLIYPSFGDNNNIGTPKFIGRDSMLFNVYDPVEDTSILSMHLLAEGVLIPRAFAVGLDAVNNRSLLTAILHENGYGEVRIEAPTDIDGNVTVRRNLGVDSSLYIQGLLEVEAMFLESDVRFKKEISAIDKGLNRILQLQPYSYFLRNSAVNKQKQFGFAAQELETVLPELVHTNQEGTKSVNYIQLIPWLTSAIQEQQKEINDLKDQLETYKKMEKRFERMEAILERNGLE